ncbi:MAG: glycine cleavage system aminomethyltransferase GcvT [cyanobacterium endosymbiont of Rhopalodia musculus]|uniref:glycine cleavage system aminomethyltransferase GcvT n=1 Tax=cyanobacterium endosymbiont of Epithemia clementina EcSB TaxID=3034674 RepID=UPI00248048FE|nr:glycine cleavage system aminomethyltransferase GcvT [cyanobacterium endosymbiont of Epithemia clementina EcSB]WGT67233.1 glycine cleavage system aminomethyltransferase GcvT [cyanobacterium endosymbiont of Epithemia clementina EcSB]
MAKSDSSVDLLRTPLYDLIIQQKAKLTEFSGWEMPVQFRGLKLEHQAVRTDVGVFDISHMGKFTLQGPQLLSSLQSLVPSDLERLQRGQAQYTVLLNSQGGIIDDIIVYNQGETETRKEKVIIIANAGTTQKDKTWFLEHLDRKTITFEDLSQEKVLIAIQGPRAISKLQPLVKENLSQLKFFGHLEGTILGKSAFIARTGYTGEDGFEVMVDPEVGQELWQSLCQTGVTPCGLGARDTLRLEAAMSLYGQDIGDGTTPLEAGLAWLVHLDSKGEFIGRKILEQQKAQRVNHRLVGLQMEGRHIARHGYPVFSDGNKVGEVTSGTLSPTLEKAIALAYVPRALSKVGSTLEIEVRGKLYPTKVVKKPFYRSPNRPYN